MDLKTWLAVAEAIDAMRIVPRLLLAAYAYYVAYLNWYILSWYMALPAAERTLEASGLAAAVITAVTGMASWFLKIYTTSGRNWDNEHTT